MPLKSFLDPFLFSPGNTIVCSDGGVCCVVAAWCTLLLQPAVAALKQEGSAMPNSPGATIGLSRRQILTALTTAVGAAAMVRCSSFLPPGSLKYYDLRRRFT
jgi:hypothetical protein